MTTSITLAPYVGPEMELTRNEIAPIAAVAVNMYPDLSAQEISGIWGLLQLDALFLDQDTITLFYKLESAAQAVVDGVVSQIRFEEPCAGGLDEIFRELIVSQNVSSETVDVAKKFLEFLGCNSEAWPPKSKL